MIFKIYIYIKIKQSIIRILLKMSYSVNNSFFDEAVEAVEAEEEEEEEEVDDFNNFLSGYPISQSSDGWSEKDQLEELQYRPFFMESGFETSPDNYSGYEDYTEIVLWINENF